MNLRFNSLAEVLDTRVPFLFIPSILGQDYWKGIVDNCKALGI